MRAENVAGELVHQIGALVRHVRGHQESDLFGSEPLEGERDEIEGLLPGDRGQPASFSNKRIMESFGPVHERRYAETTVDASVCPAVGFAPVRDRRHDPAPFFLEYHGAVHGAEGADRFDGVVGLTVPFAPFRGEGSGRTDVNAGAAEAAGPLKVGPAEDRTYLGVVASLRESMTSKRTADPVGYMGRYIRIVTYLF